ncbi:MAG: ACT domain-containing protein [Marinomonas sp.]
MPKYCLTVTCPSRRGIVAAISGFLAEKGCTITDSAQFDDTDTDRFFTRISLVSETGSSQEELIRDFSLIAEEFAMEWEVRGEDEKMKVLIMVSRYGHCLNDLLFRSSIGTLPIEIVGVVSNHFDHQKLVVNNDIPFHYIKVTKENKATAEAQLLNVVEESGA